MKALKYGILIALTLALLGAGQGLAAPVAQEAIWVITAPAEGTSVSGEVTIQGTASLPNFDSYGVLYASGPRPTAESQWVPIVFGVKTMVVNGPLTTWDTAELPNGQYTLALAVYEVGNTEPKLHFTNNITIFNEETTPTPEPTATQPAEEQPTEEPSDVAAPVAPTIEQPPTATPRPTPTLSPAEATEPEPEDEIGLPQILSMDAIKETFKAGVWLAVLIYVFGGLYVAIKAAIRYYLKHQHRKQV